MLRKIKDSTIELLKKELNNLEISLPIEENDIETIFEFFENKEIELSILQDEGEQINQQELDVISIAVDDFLIEANSSISIDLDDLNKKLNLK